MEDLRNYYFNKPYYVCIDGDKLVYTNEPFGEYVEISREEFYEHVNKQTNKKYARQDFNSNK
jgi:hypothetical protein